MMRNKTYITIILSALIISCTNSKEITGNDTTPSENQEKKEAVDQKKEFDMIVSFISIGMGIDFRTKAQLDKYIAKFNLESETKIDPAKKHWGREGEVNYYFDLKNLSTNQQKMFIASVEEICSASKLVNIKFGN